MMIADHLSPRYRASAWMMAGAAAWAFVVFGCGRKPDKWELQRPKTYSANGRVLWDGKPEPDVVVTFESRSDGPTAVGFTDATGRFTLKTFKEGDGAAAGEHAVWLTKSVMLDAGDIDANRPPSFLVVTPKKYAAPATSGLTAKVAETGQNDFTIEITGPRASP
jgi:hypothetical protein